jgi:hypothetical protein
VRLLQAPDDTGTTAQFPPTTSTGSPARRPSATAAAISPPISPRLTVGSASRRSSGKIGSTTVVVKPSTTSDAA